MADSSDEAPRDTDRSDESTAASPWSPSSVDAADETFRDASSGETVSSLDPTTAAYRLLESVKRRNAPTPYLNALAEADASDLETVRTDRQAGLAFWLNVYNAATQLLLDRRPALFESRVRFFRANAITIAGTALSLDDIEHGILRGSRSKYGLGYLPRLERTGLNKTYRLEADPRIHFALNCGAASCPAILAYEPDSIDDQLDESTHAYLDEHVEYDAERGRVRVPRLCLWFVGDFGGRSGIRRFLREFDQILPESSPSLRFVSYDWEKTPRRFGW
ncbi:DUF547 domain-containing protein [Natronorubrum sp. JWXQ-INN-674]|uniref:DUF547 domain-containing protein n=1 Tax=Natronorubrum halalkaliphilum TaxID=2691917 RepID=A0A6B0VL59_9EURY|nr:DUF547 domain-containing protein [Natronorubrum halalkaliphilum]MXV61913.1 DUF547 domain-containing protein [Natronorubrum halalkaliphilum]